MKTAEVASLTTAATAEIGLIDLIGLMVKIDTRRRTDKIVNVEAMRIRYLKHPTV